MPEPVQEACDELAESLEIPGLALSGSYDEAARVISVAARGPEEARERLLEIALDLFFYLPDGMGPGDRYEFTLKTPAHEIRLATAVDAMLDTGEVTPERWEAFHAQLELTEDGKPLVYPAPDFGP